LGVDIVILAVVRCSDCYGSWIGFRSDVLLVFCWNVKFCKVARERHVKQLGK